MKTAALIALFAFVAVSNAAVISKPVGCDICIRVIGKVITDVTGTDHNRQQLEQAIQKECHADQGLPQVWEQEACIVELSFAIPRIQHDLDNAATSNAQKICTDIRVCH